MEFQVGDASRNREVLVDQYNGSSQENVTNASVLEDDFIDPDYIIEDGDEDYINAVRRVQIGAPIYNRRGLEERLNSNLDTQMNFVVQENESEYEDSDQLNTDSDSNDEERVRFSEFHDRDIENPTFEIGMLFSSREQFKEACRNHGINNRFQVKFKRNTLLFVESICANQKCEWRVYASKVDRKDENNPTFQIRSGHFMHTCPKVHSNFHCSYIWIAKRYVENFRSDQDWKVQALIDQIQREKSLNISFQKAYRAKNLALKMINGDEKSQYQNIFRYRAEILRSNPGSTVKGRYKNGRFIGVYICFAALKNAFKAGCRKLICIDGCWLKGSYGGQLFSAVGIDPNDCMFPIATGMAETESKETWIWFLELLEDDLDITDFENWTFMSDRQKGLIGAVEYLFPGAYHRFCVRHMYTNFRQHFKGKELKDLLWAAAKAPYPEAMNKKLDAIEKISVEAREWLRERDARQWSRAYFSEKPQCDMLLNNLCECFNKYILDARDKGVITMNELIRIKLMKRMKAKANWSSKYEGKWCPKILKKLEKAKDLAFHFKATFNGTPRAQVNGWGEQFVIDLEAKTCACRRWQLTGIPCSHAIAAIFEQNEHPEDYLDPIYSLDTYKKVYSHFIEPINGHDQWPTPENHPFVVPPSPIKVKRGRKKTARRKEPEEIEQAATKKKLCRKGNVYMTCSKCGGKNHNKKKCQLDQSTEQGPSLYGGQMSSSVHSTIPNTMTDQASTSVNQTYVGSRYVNNSRGGETVGSENRGRSQPIRGIRRGGNTTRGKSTTQGLTPWRL